VDLTYEQLFDILRREKGRDELQQLDSAFYDGVRGFLSTKEDQIRLAQSEHGVASLAAQRAHIELTNAKKILKELYERRERKIVTMALHRTRTESAIIDHETLLPEEKGLLEELVHLLVDGRERILSRIELRTPMIVTPPRQYAITRDEDEPRVRDDEPRTFAVESKPLEPKRVVERVQASRATETSAGDTFTTEETNIKVRFLAPVPKFVGKDLRVFGPFEEGATAELPDVIAQILIKKGRAQEMD
jgi:DNA replication initiation complex subunit (GINS family)